MNEEKFRVEFLEDVVKFIDELDEKTRDKLLYNIWRAKRTNDKDLFKKLKNEIWEFRTKYNKTQIRLLAFWDKSDKQDTIVISTNAFVKKTNKVPQKEIDKAERLRTQYFNDKNKDNENI